MYRRRREPGRGAGIIRVVQAVLGIWGRSWTKVVEEAPGAELVAVVDPDPRALGHAEAIPGYVTL
jgi:predicted dehydrogenase